MARGKYEYWLTPDGLLELEAYARDGLTDEQIASNLGIRRETLYVWKKQYTEISEALSRGKKVIDIQVENALLQRALGYEYKEVKVKEELGICTEKTITTKQVVPDTTAQIFWLKNRKPYQWAGRKNHHTSDSYEQCNQENVKQILIDTIKQLSSGEMDASIANPIISACNAVLDSIRTDEQQKKIDELEQLMERTDK